LSHLYPIKKHIMASKIDFKVAPPAAVLREIGARVAAARLQQNITQAELAEKYGIAARSRARKKTNQTTAS